MIMASVKHILKPGSFPSEDYTLLILEMFLTCSSETLCALSVQIKHAHAARH